MQGNYFDAVTPRGEAGEIGMTQPNDGGPETTDNSAASKCFICGNDLTIIYNPHRAELDVIAERRRQVREEGWTVEHDDTHAEGSMAIAAACYALAGRPELEVQTTNLYKLWQWAGWSWGWFKPKDKRRNLVRAAALIIAEIERIDRAMLKERAK